MERAVAAAQRARLKEKAAARKAKNDFRSLGFSGLRCAWAAEGGLLEVLKWARENDCPLDEWTRLFATEMGYVES